MILPAAYSNWPAYPIPRNAAPNWRASCGLFGEGSRHRAHRRLVGLSPVALLTDATFWGYAGLNSLSGPLRPASRKAPRS